MIRYNHILRPVHDPLPPQPPRIDAYGIIVLWAALHLILESCVSSSYSFSDGRRFLYSAAQGELVVAYFLQHLLCFALQALLWLVQLFGPSILQHERFRVSSPPFY